jgi:putative redox protein
MDAKVTWQGRMSFIGAADTGYQLSLGTIPLVGGENDGFQPMELLAIGLAGCTAMDVISILEKKRQAVSAFEVQVHTERNNEHPKVFTRAVVEYSVSGNNLEQAALLRAIELSATRYCPALAMFSKLFPIQFQYLIYQDQDEGGRRLVASGVHTPAGRPEMPV